MVLTNRALPRHPAPTCPTSHPHPLPCSLPSLNATPACCAHPLPARVHAGGAITVSADVTGPGAPFSFSWAAFDAALGGTCTSPPTVLASTGANGGTVYTVSTTCGRVNAAGGTSTTYTLTVTNSCGKPFFATVKANVVTAPLSAIQAIPPQTVASGEELERLILQLCRL